MGIGDVFGLYLYDSDDTNQYVVKLSALVATQGGFGAPIPDVGTNRVWPYSEKELRHVYGRSSGGKRAKLVCASVGAANTVQSAGFILVGGTGFTFTGYSGEKRKGSKI